MQDKQMTDEQIKELLFDSVDKLRRSEEIDSKMAVEMSNTLNWIIVFATLFFGFMVDPEIADFNYKDELILTYKLSIISLIVLLVIYKFLFNRYDLIKKVSIDFLDTQYIELKSDLFNVKSRMKKEHNFCVTFINAFRDGEFLCEGNEKRIEYYRSQDRKLLKFATILKRLYYGAASVFVINLTIAIVFILKK